MTALTCAQAVAENERLRDDLKRCEAKRDAAMFNNGHWVDEIHKAVAVERQRSLAAEAQVATLQRELGVYQSMTNTMATEWGKAWGMENFQIAQHLDWMIGEVRKKYALVTPPVAETEARGDREKLGEALIEWAAKQTMSSDEHGDEWCELCGARGYFETPQHKPDCLHVRAAALAPDAPKLGSEGSDE